MSINWVMLSEREGFVRLPNERVLYTSPPRTALSIKTPNTYPGAQPFALSSGSGSVHLTNQRIVYIPQSSTPALQSFSAPILHLHDSHVSAPFFGPNVWSSAVQPVSGGGLPSLHALFEVKITFKEGGAYDFQTTLERIKERTQQAVEVARANGTMGGSGVATGGGRGAGALSPVNMAAVDLEQLPAYQENDSNGVPLNPPHAAASSGPPAPSRPNPPNVMDSLSNDGGVTQTAPVPSSSTNNAPSEPPPGYEEAQRESVANEMERLTDGLQSDKLSLQEK